jgi:hypothetical protein
MFKCNCFSLDFKIWYQAIKSGQGVLAAKTGPKILEFFEKLYDVPYPLSKTDMAGTYAFIAVSVSVCLS